MKELSIEQKARRYDDAIEVIRKCTTDKYGCIIGIKPSDLFPELVEIGDDRIRKELIDYFSASHATDTFRGIPWDRVVSWLEKQGEQKPIDKVESKFKVGDHIKPIDKCLGSSRIIEEVCDGLYVTDKGALYFEFEDNWELVEKPAWSEEDELMLTSIIQTLKLTNGAAQMKIAWLKSIKDRVRVQLQPKLDDKQLKFLNELMSFLLTDYPKQWAKYGELLKSLRDYRWL